MDPRQYNNAPNGDGSAATRRLEEDIAAKQRGASSRSMATSRPGAYSAPGAVSVAAPTAAEGGGAQLSQMERDVLAKQRGGSANGNSARPGAVMVSGGGGGAPAASRGSGQLSQLEQDIAAKRMGRSSHSTMESRPGAVSVAATGGGGSAGAQQMRDLESAIRQKEQGAGISHPGAVASQGLTQMEQDIAAKQRGMSSRTMDSTRPGAVSVAAGGGGAGAQQMRDLESAIRQKEQGAGVSRPGVVASQGLTQMERDIAAKQRGMSSRTMDSRPGAVSVTAGGGGAGVQQMRDLEGAIRQKEQGAGISRPGAVASQGLTQMERDIAAKQRGMSSRTMDSRPGAVSVAAAGGGAGAQQMRDLESAIRQKEQGATPGAMASQGLTQMERDIAAKQRGMSPRAVGSMATPGAQSIPGDGGRSHDVGGVGGSAGGTLSQLEADLMQKQRGAAARSSASTPGVISVGAQPGGAGGGQGSLSRIEQDIMMKQQGRAANVPSRPGAVAVASGSLDSLETSILQKQGGILSGSGGIAGAQNAGYAAGGAGNLSCVEQDIMAKQQGRGASSAPSRPGAVAVASGTLDSLETSILQKQRDIPSGPGGNAGAQNAGPAAAGTGNPSRVEQDIMAKQRGRPASSTPSRPGAVAVATGSTLDSLETSILQKQRGISSGPGGSVGAQNVGPTAGGAGNLSRVEQDIMAKQQGRMASMPSRPGAVAVASGSNLDSLETSILQKQRGFSSGPGGSQQGGVGPQTAVPKASGTGSLSRIEQDIMMKQQGRPSGMPSTPGAVPVAAGSNLDSLESSILQKQRGFEGGPSRAQQGSVGMPNAGPTSGATGTLNRIEDEIMMKQQGRPQNPASTPGAMAVASGTNLDTFETSILQKQRGFSTGAGGTQDDTLNVAAARMSPGGPAENASGHLAQMELDLLSKQRASSNSAPGATVSSLNQAEQDILRKQHGNSGVSQPGALTVAGGELTQMEQSIRAKSSPYQSQNSASAQTGEREVPVGGAAGLSLMERDVLAKEEARKSAPAAAATTSMMSQFEADVAAKTGAYSQGVAAVSGGSEALADMESDLINKSRGRSFQASMGPGAVSSHTGGSDLNELEDAIRGKSGFAPSTGPPAVASMPPQSGGAADGLHSLEADLIGKSGGPPVAPPLPYQPEPHVTQPQVEHMRPPSPPLQTTRPDFAPQNDSGPPPSMGENVDSVPAPMSIPYDFSDEPEVAPVETTDVNSFDQVPSVEVPSGGIEAYVPATVVEAAGVAVVMSTEEEERLEKQKRKKYISYGTVCVCLIAIAIIVPTVLTATSGGSTEPEEVPPSAAPSLAPSSAPSGAPTSNFFSTFLDTVLKPLNVSDASVLDDVNSPQYQAALWLILEDSETYWPQNDLTMRSSKVIQRYALATYHYSTDGDNWRQCGKSSGNCVAVRWLDPVDECTWFGVTCDANGFVEMLSFLTEFESNDMHGPLPREMSLLTELKRFIAPDNRLQGNLYDPFHGLFLLDTVVLSTNQMNGTLPIDVINQNSNLGVLNVAFNQMSGTVPTGLTSQRLSHLQLYENKLTGTIPEDIGNATRLQILDLQGNDIEGTIPSSLYELSSLSIFAINNNTKIGGTIDTRIGQLKVLTKFEAGNTRLVGSIPKELYQLTRLTDIIFSSANMTGPLLEDIKLLNATLLQLDLQQNTFSGPLPQALDVLTALEGLHLDANSFTGTISDKVCAERGVGYQKLFKLYADCNIVCNCNDNEECRD